MSGFVHLDERNKEGLLECVIERARLRDIPAFLHLENFVCHKSGISVKCDIYKQKIEKSGHVAKFVCEPVFLDPFATLDKISHLDIRLQASVSSKFPRDQSDGLLWNLLSQLVCPSAVPTGASTLLNLAPPSTSAMPITVPKATTSTNQPQQPSPTPQTSQAVQPPYLGAELASALLASGKFPPSLIGLFPPFPPPLGMNPPVSQSSRFPNPSMS